MTLIELVVMMAIAAILATILFPVFARVPANTRSSTGQSQLFLHPSGERFTPFVCIETGEILS